MRADGNATLAGGELANLHMDFWSDGFISYSGRLGYSYPSFENPTFSLFGQTDYWIEPVPGGRPRPLPGRRRPRGPDPRRADHLRCTASSTTTGRPAARSACAGRTATAPATTRSMIGFPTCDVSDVAIQPTRSHDGHPAARGELERPGRRPAAGPRAHRRARRAGADPAGRGRGRGAEAHARRSQGPHLHADHDGQQGRAGRGLRERLPPRRQRHAAARPAPARGHVDADAGRRLAGDRQRALRQGAAGAARHRAREGARSQPRPDLERARARRPHDPLHRAGQGRRPDDRGHRQAARPRALRDRGRRGRPAEDRGAGHDGRRRAGDDARRRPLPRARPAAAAQARAS